MNIWELINIIEDQGGPNKKLLSIMENSRKHGLRAMVQNIWTKDTGPDTMEDRTRIMIQDTKNRAITIVVNS
jgi:hypothetical protein